MTSAEIDKILSAIDRFKEYTVFLSDDALIKLMSSLVAMSLNNLAVTAKSSSSNNLSSYNDRNEALRGAGKDLGIASLAKKNNRPLRMPPLYAGGYQRGGRELQPAGRSGGGQDQLLPHRLHLADGHQSPAHGGLPQERGGPCRGCERHARHDLKRDQLPAPAQPPNMEIVGASSKTIRASLDGSDMLSSDEVLFSAVMPSFQTSSGPPVPRRYPQEQAGGG